MEINMSKENMTFTFDDVDNEIDFKELPGLDETPREPIQEDEIEPSPTPVKEEESEEDEALKEEYLVIYDAIMFEDTFEKTYKLGKNYSVTFSTRSADADMKISRQLDGMDFATMHALQTMSAVLTMSHSLAELNGKDLRTSKVSERYEYIRAKSSHLIEVLSKKMIEFDQLVREALRYGGENF